MSPSFILIGEGRVEPVRRVTVPLDLCTTRPIAKNLSRRRSAMASQVEERPSEKRGLRPAPKRSSRSNIQKNGQKHQRARKAVAPASTSFQRLQGGKRQTSAAAHVDGQSLQTSLPPLQLISGHRPWKITIFGVLIVGDGSLKSFQQRKTMSYLYPEADTIRLKM